MDLPQVFYGCSRALRSGYADGYFSTLVKKGSGRECCEQIPNAAKRRGSGVYLSFSWMQMLLMLLFGIEVDSLKT